MIPYRLLFLLGSAVALTSCSVFQPDPPENTADPYGAANAYNQNPNANPGGYPAYGQGGQQYGPPPAGGYGAGSAYGAANNYGTGGGYSQPNYSQPYTQPPDAGYGGAYSAPPPAGNYGAASGRTHTVASGENLSKIARRYGVTTDALMRANNLTDANFIRAGQTLTIP